MTDSLSLKDPRINILATDARPRASHVMRILWSAVGFLATLHVALWHWTLGPPRRALSILHDHDDRQEQTTFTEAYTLPEPSSSEDDNTSKSTTVKSGVRGIHQQPSSSNKQSAVALPLSHAEPKQQLKHKKKKKRIPEPDPTGIFPLPEPKAPKNMTFTQLEHLVTQQQQRRLNPTIDKEPVPVVLWPHVYLPLSSSAEYIHLFDNALQESPYLMPLNDMSPNSVVDPRMVWWVDLHMAESEFCDYDDEEEDEEEDEDTDDDTVNNNDNEASSKDEALEVNDDQCWCRELTKDVLRVLSIRYSKGLLTLPWPIHIIDLHDGSSANRCSRLDDILGLEWVQYFKRNQVVGREWKEDSNWVEVGRRFSDVNRTWGEYFRPISLPVRTDIVEATASYLKSLKKPQFLWDPIERLDRPIDVTHFWPLDEEGVGSTHVARLRLFVSIIIDSMGKREGLKTFTGMKGKPLKEGRRGVDKEYIQGMLETKIMVVTQRDAWEGHYRLFEAMVSGACVFSDTMIHLPDGVQNGTSIVLFDGSESLRSLISYYIENESERLEIAKQGRLAAMSRHRSWHLMEMVTFRKPATICSDIHEESRCPFNVHASEIQIS